MIIKMILGIEHIGIMTNNTKKLADWCADVLEFRIVYTVSEDDCNPKYFLKGKLGSMIEIFSDLNKNGNNIEQRQQKMHIALLVDNYEKTVKELQKRVLKGRGTIIYSLI